MKVYILIIFLSIFSLTSVFGQCSEDIYLKTQLEIDNFSQDYGCTEIEGDLVIGSSLGLPNNANVSNLEGLQDVVKIEGSLVINQTPNLSSLAGLENLLYVGESLNLNDTGVIDLEGIKNLNHIGLDIQLKYNYQLIDISTFENITSVNGGFTLYLNYNLENLQALKNLNNISGTLAIEGIGKLQNLDGLENLKSLRRLKLRDNRGLKNLLALSNLTELVALDIQGCDSLKNLKGLGNVESLERHLSINYNNSLEDFQGLEKLTSIGVVDIRSVDNLRNFRGLENVENIVGSFLINNNKNLISFQGLESLKSVGSIFTISSNYNLQSLIGLGNLKNIDGRTSIHSNNDLENLEGLENLETVNDFFTISRNENLQNLVGLESLKYLGDNFSISYNDNLKSLKGLENLKSANGYVNIRHNEKLEDLMGLENLETLEGYFFVGNCENLKNLTGLEKLKSTSQLNIRDNENLERIGFESLENVKYGIEIINNDNLVSLDGFENVRDVEVIKIIGNPKLETCCPIINWGTDFQDLVIQNNATNCNSLGAIYSFCLENQIQAQAFHDINSNGIFDASEQFLVRNFNLEPNAFYGYSDEMGINHFYLTDFGDYTISFDDASPLWIIDSIYNNVEVSYQDPTFGDTLIHFPLTSVANIVSQRIDITSSITRCNRETNYWLTYSNTGTVTTSGIIELVPDDLAAFVSSDPPADSTSNGKLYWFYNDLYPTHSEKIHLIYEMPGVEDIGEIINFLVNIRTNEGYAGHKDVLSSELICAYDPNDKLNTPSGYGKENYTLFGDTLEYTVRFQNTGNDTAFNVVIRDELSELLDLRTFQPIASSHNMEAQIDIESRVATFKFNDIYLPDSFVNEPASHGFVKYQILGRAGLNENSDVQNTASIYFDKNPAIVTNTVSNRMVSVLPSLPVISANPFELNFGEISISNPSVPPQILTISNLGDLPLEINAFEFGSAAFNSGELQDLTVEGMSSQDIFIYFEPTEDRDYLSELVLKSNAGDININLSGKAMDLAIIHQAEIQIYPNPNKGKFSIQSWKGNILSYSISNNLGEVISEQKTNENFLQLDLSAQSKGSYFISMKTKDAVIVKRVVVY